MNKIKALRIGCIIGIICGILFSALFTAFICIHGFLFYIGLQWYDLLILMVDVILLILDHFGISQLYDIYHNSHKED